MFTSFHKPRFEGLFFGLLFSFLFIMKCLNNDSWANDHILLYLAIMAVFFFYTSRLRRVKKQNASEIKDMRNQISADLHDDVGSVLAALAMQAELFAKENPEMEVSKLERMQAMSHEAMANMRDIVWAMNTGDKTWGQLIDRLQNHAFQILDSSNTQVQFKLEAINRKEPVDSETCKHFYLIGKEAITNTARHSNADKVTIRFKYKAGKYQFSVEDNGTIQANKNLAPSGIGLENMQSRAKKMGGKLWFQHTRGFRVMLSVSL